jgi:hypothetical protein
LLRKNEKNLAVNHKTDDELFKAAQSRKPDWSKGSKVETGVKITVGIGSESL